MRITQAKPEDYKKLTEITFQGKSHWGYSKEQMEIWRKDLTISSEYIIQNEVFKLILNEKIIGYYSFFFVDEKTIKLDNLFLLPEYIGKGIGKFMMIDFLTRVKQEKSTKIVLEADPNAESFYTKFGFKTVTQKETAIKNRYLPVMELPLY